MSNVKEYKLALRDHRSMPINESTFMSIGIIAATDKARRIARKTPGCCFWRVLQFDGVHMRTVSGVVARFKARK